MSGFCGYMNLYRAACLFLEAGGDCLLFMKDDEEYISEMKQLILDGALKTETLKDRAYRMLCFAKEYFDETDTKQTCEFDRDEAERCAQEVTEKAVGITRDRANILPLKLNKNSKIAHVVLHSSWVTDLSCTEKVTQELSQYATVETFVDPGGNAILALAKSGDYDYILCSVLEPGSYGLNTAKLCGPAARNMMCGWMRYKTPVVFVGYYNHRFGDTYEASVDTIINTYGVTKHTAKAIVDKLIK
jgi:beta-glucosidase-like glycosyl hydrolase